MRLVLESLGFPREREREPQTPGPTLDFLRHGRPRVVSQVDTITCCVLFSSVILLRTLPRHWGAQVLTQALSGWLWLGEILLGVSLCISQRLPPSSKPPTPLPSSLLSCGLVGRILCLTQSVGMTQVAVSEGQRAVVLPPRAQTTFRLLRSCCPN